MQLTRFSDLSLRLLLYLASRDKPLETVVTVRAAAELFNVPYTHMVKVAYQLGLAGLVETAKGRGGGLRLGRPPESLHIGEIVRITEPKGGLIDCWTQPCPLRADCLLKNALDEAHEAFFRALDQYSLAQMAQTPSLQKLVQIIG